MEVSDYAGAKMDWRYIPDSRRLENELRVGELQGGALACSPSLYRYPDNDRGWRGTASVRLDDRSTRHQQMRHKGLNGIR